MEQQPLTEPAEQESVFSEEDLLNNHEYDKHVRQARNAIWVIAAIQFVAAFITAFTGPEDIFWYNLGIMGVIALIFLALGVWAQRKPYPAILSTLVLYSLLVVVDLIADPTSIIKGIILKVAIVIYLVKGLKDAQEAQRLKEILNNR